MYTILIVDDEKIEREGIQKLMVKQGLDLKTVTAENGEAALRILQSQPVDILLTDIKMPFMDGLELAEKASVQNPDLEVIIYSAFSDFEYAKRALNTNASHYLLKPIDIAEFRKVLGEAVSSCEAREIKQAEHRKLLEGYQKGMRYEKEKRLLDALYGMRRQGDVEVLDPAERTNGGSWIQLALIDFSCRFFDGASDGFRQSIERLTGWEFDFLNLNERQSVLFMHSAEPMDRQALQSWGERVLNLISEQFGLSAALVIGEPVRETAGLPRVYHEMEQKLDSKFFFEGSVLLFADEREPPASTLSGFEAPQGLDKIEQCLACGDTHGAKAGIELLFSHLQSTRNTSVIYTKFLFSGIMQKIVAKLRQQGMPEPSEWLEPIVRTDSLNELKNLLISAVDSLEPGPDAGEPEGAGRRNSKVIRQVLSMIEKEYMQDLSLEYFAEKVYLTPSYLSYLFKKETGTSLVRYITSYRLDKAAEMLVRTQMKVADIGERLGYANPSYFIQTFRNHFGVSPAKYRESQP